MDNCSSGLTASYGIGWRDAFQAGALRILQSTYDDARQRAKGVLHDKPCKVQHEGPAVIAIWLPRYLEKKLVICSADMMCKTSTSGITTDAPWKSCAPRLAQCLRYWVSVSPWPLWCMESRTTMYVLLTAFVELAPAEGIMWCPVEPAGSCPGLASLWSRMGPSLWYTTYRNQCFLLSASE